MLQTAAAGSCISARALLNVAQMSAPVVPTPISTSTSGAYVPKTKDDNTPWRFDMNQNGKRMTAEEFDAWMKAKGIHVATGKAAATKVDAQPLTDDKN